MTNLHKNWLTEGIFDFEYRKYVLLAYLQDIDKEFVSNRLHPHLPELHAHFNTCQRIRADKSSMQKAFPKNLTGIDLKTWQLRYEETLQDDSYMEDLNYILDFAIPRFKKSISQGNERFHEVSESLTISPVGIVPLRQQEGYLLFLHTFQPLISIFSYQVALFNELRERILTTNFLETVRIGLGYSVPQIKVDLTKKNRSLPNPATYMIESKFDYPLHEALLPVTKKLILKEINVA